jgi:hypothetical protein
VTFCIWGLSVCTILFLNCPPTYFYSSLYKWPKFNQNHWSSLQENYHLVFWDQSEGSPTLWVGMFMFTKYRSTMNKFWIPNMNKISWTVRVLLRHVPRIHARGHTHTYIQMAHQTPLYCILGGSKFVHSSNLSIKFFTITMLSQKYYVYEKVKQYTLNSDMKVYFYFVYMIILRQTLPYWFMTLP